MVFHHNYSLVVSVLHAVKYVKYPVCGYVCSSVKTPWPVCNCDMQDLIGAIYLHKWPKKINVTLSCKSSLRDLW